MYVCETGSLLLNFHKRDVDKDYILKHLREDRAFAN